MNNSELTDSFSLFASSCVGLNFFCSFLVSNSRIRHCLESELNEESCMCACTVFFFVYVSAA